MTRDEGLRALRADAEDGDVGGPRRGRPRRPLAVEYRVAAGVSGDELRRRELELERLIIEAACHRAARLAADGRGDALAGDDPSPGSAAADHRAALGTP